VTVFRAADFARDGFELGTRDDCKACRAQYSSISTGPHSRPARVPAALLYARVLGQSRIPAPLGRKRARGRVVRSPEREFRAALIAKLKKPPLREGGVCKDRSTACDKFGEKKMTWHDHRSRAASRSGECGPYQKGRQASDRQALRLVAPREVRALCTRGGLISQRCTTASYATRSLVARQRSLAGSIMTMRESLPSTLEDYSHIRA